MRLLSAQYSITTYNHKRKILKSSTDLVFLYDSTYFHRGLCCVCENFRIDKSDKIWMREFAHQFHFHYGVSATLFLTETHTLDSNFLTHKLRRTRKNSSLIDYSERTLTKFNSCNTMNDKSERQLISSIDRERKIQTRCLILNSLLWQVIHGRVLRRL